MTTDFWFFAGLGIMFCLIGYGCDTDHNVEAKARAEVWRACSWRIEIGQDVPDACRPLIPGEKGNLLTAP